MLTESEKTTLLDISAYIVWSVNHDNGFYATLGNVGHDVIGLLNHEQCFVPRTDGYQKALFDDFALKVGV